jgi:UPF0042 nucleotide-binding protein
MDRDRPPGALRPGAADADGPLDVVLVTGPSGAGRSTAIRVLEDAGFEAIDNLPLALLDRLVASSIAEPAGTRRPLALGIDARTRDFEVDAVLDRLAGLRSDPRVDARLLFVDCGRDVLVARFSETRRRHPMAPGEDVVAGIDREAALIADLADRADVVIDTTALTVHDLRDEVMRWFGRGRGLAVSVQSFSYKRGVPRGLDIVWDLRFLANPHWVPELRGGTGRDPDVQAHVTADPAFGPFYAALGALILETLPAYRAEGRSHLAIGLGCTGGRHRSVAVAERLTATLAQAGWPVSQRHRELDRIARAAGAGAGPAGPPGGPVEG